VTCQALSTRDDFDMWIFKMDDDLDNFLARLPDNVRRSLDFSPGALDVLEKWFLDNYPTHLSLLEPSETPTLDGVARYIGETFRKHAGGHWTIDLDNPQNAFFGLPTLTGYPVPVAPHTLATTALHRRTGNVLHTVLDNTLKQTQAQPNRP
jgi:hypothetical protein